ASNKVGIGQVTLRGTEYLAAGRPCGAGLLLDTRRYADELRDAEPMLSEIDGAKTDKELLELATPVNERKPAPFDATSYSDSYAKALHDLLEAKQKNKKPPRVTTTDDEGDAKGVNVVDLMSALKESVNSTEKKKSRKKKAS